MGEALSGEFGGKVLNPDGIEIDLPFLVFKVLKSSIFSRVIPGRCAASSEFLSCTTGARTTEDACL